MTQTLFLTKPDIAELTGRKRAALQIRALVAMGWPFVVGGDGRPKVLRETLEMKLGIGNNVNKPFEPNWDAIKHGQKKKAQERLA